MMGDFIKDEFSRNGLSKLAALVAMPLLKRFSRRVDPAASMARPLLGLRGLVFKSHGSADAVAFENALAAPMMPPANGCSTGPGPHRGHAASRREHVAGRHR